MCFVYYTILYCTVLYYTIRYYTILTTQATFTSLRQGPSLRSFLLPRQTQVVPEGLAHQDFGNPGFGNTGCLTDIKLLLLLIIIIILIIRVLVIIMN